MAETMRSFGNLKKVKLNHVSQLEVICHQLPDYNRVNNRVNS